MRQNIRKGGRGHAVLTREQILEAIKEVDDGSISLNLKAYQLGVSGAALSKRIKKIRLEGEKESPQVTELEARIRQLEDENAKLRETLEPKKGNLTKAPRREQILEALGNGKLMTYEDVAMKIGKQTHVVRNCINGFPKGMVKKFKDEEGKVWIQKQH